MHKYNFFFNRPKDFAFFCQNITINQRSLLLLIEERIVYFNVFVCFKNKQVPNPMIKNLQSISPSRPQSIRLFFNMQWQFVRRIGKRHSTLIGNHRSTQLMLQLLTSHMSHTTASLRNLSIL